MECFAKHIGRLYYCGRPAEGRPMGSDLVEGSIKPVGLRLQARAARSRVDNVDKVTRLGCPRQASPSRRHGRSLKT